MAVTKILNSNTKSHGKITEITQNNKLKSNTRKGYVYTNVGRVALIFYTELTE